MTQHTLLSFDSNDAKVADEATPVLLFVAKRFLRFVNNVIAQINTYV